MADHHEQHVDHYLPRRDSMLDVLMVKDTDIGDYHIPVVKGDVKLLPDHIKQFIIKYFKICRPKAVYICDGSEEEAEEIVDKLVVRGLLFKLDKMDHCELCRTDPADVARVESKTFLVTDNKYDSVPHVKEGVDGILGKWMSAVDMNREMDNRFPDCMKGRVMYVIPFSMGPVGSPLSKNGVQLTDSNYVVLSMRIMTRVTPKIWSLLRNSKEFVQCIHSIGAPRPLERKLVNHWPCNPEKLIVAHYTAERKILSFGSGYGGNSLLGKKCFALRIASSIARDEGWLAEHMLLMSVISPKGHERFIAAAFPSACGKTNLAMLKPTLPGWEIHCIGDDIAWMRFDEDGRLRAINPEAGFFGVAPGTNWKTNPIAMETVQKNTIFTNVAMTSDGGVFWEGMEKDVDPEVDITTWTGDHWHLGRPGKAAHPNSRFCTPANQCPIIHSLWEDPAGVPVDAIIFGGRRPEGVPLVTEAFSWEHGVYMGAALKSETTAAAAEYKEKVIMHDPMAMRPFVGYNFGQYLQHWLSLNQPGRHMPRVYHVNWFRLDENKKFVWPGFGDNIRVVDWICRRLDGEDIAEPSPVGLLPKKGSIDLSGISDKVDWDKLFHLPKDYYTEDIRETRQFLDDQVGEDLPKRIRKEIDDLEARINAM